MIRYQVVSYYCRGYRSITDYGPYFRFRVAAELVAELYRWLPSKKGFDIEVLEDGP